MQEINTAYSSFELIRKNNFLYVDKTKYIYQMIANKPRMIFLSRPRRFGKSLTLSTLDAAFRGKRELFNGLYIDSTDYDWKEYPVIHVDFGLCGATTAEDCALWINGKLDDIATEYHVELAPALYYTKFDRLITERFLAWRTDSPDHEIHLIGINFSSAERNITEWKEEVL